MTWGQTLGIVGDGRRITSIPLGARIATWRSRRPPASRTTSLEHDRVPVSGELPTGWLTWVALPLPTLLGLFLNDAPRGDDLAIEAAGVVWPIAMVAAAVGFAAHHHETGRSPSGWIACALSLPPVAIGLEAIATGGQPTAEASPDAARLYLVGGTLCLAWAIAHRGRPAPRMPIATGALGGAVVFGAAHLIGAAMSSGPLEVATMVWLSVASATCFVVAVHAVLGTVRRGELGRTIVWPLLTGCGALVLGVFADHHFPVAAIAQSAAGILELGAAACLMAVAVRLLHVLSGYHCDARSAATDRARRRERDLREAQATIHEVRATVAGLANATRLIEGAPDLPEHVHHRLVSMGNAEIARMERLLTDPGTRVSHVADLCDALLPIVESVRHRGHRVHLRADRGQTHAHADEVAHIVHVLLENAVRHGAGPVDVVLERRPHEVLISVTDEGPGVPSALRSRLFDWGVSGAGSTGIGLHDGSTRARAIGGRIQLAQHEKGRTRFELVLPSGTWGPV